MHADDCDKGGRRMCKVLIVGQTPPPYVGQAIMLDCLVRSRMPDVELCHLPMALSANVGELGRFRWSKFFRLLPIIARIVYARLVHGVRIFYYAPAGPNRVSLFRDFAILLPTRWLFSKTIFHFQAGGLSDLYPRLPRWQRALFRRAYFHADAGIRLSELTPDDARVLQARREYVVPNGVADPCPHWRRPAGGIAATNERPLRVLFMAMLRESKGLLVLIEACGRLAARGVPFRLEVVGQFESDEFADRVRDRVAALNLEENVRFRGVLTGAEKSAAFAQSDVFCMPTFYENEAFPVVLLEAMAFGLPVVATRWRGVPSIVDEDETGFLVETHDVDAVAARLARLADNAPLRRRMAIAAREKYLREYTIQRHLELMRRVFLDVAGIQKNVEAEPAEEHIEPTVLVP